MRSEGSSHVKPDAGDTHYPDLLFPLSSKYYPEGFLNLKKHTVLLNMCNDYAILVPLWVAHSSIWVH